MLPYRQPEPEPEQYGQGLPVRPETAYRASMRSAVVWRHFAIVDMRRRIAPAMHVVVAGILTVVVAGILTVVGRDEAAALEKFSVARINQLRETTGKPNQCRWKLNQYLGHQN